MPEQKPDPNEKKDVDESKSADNGATLHGTFREGINLGEVKINQAPLGAGVWIPDGTLRHFNQIPPITLHIDPGEAGAKDIADLYSALNDLYQHFGGSQLKFVSNGTKVLASEEEYA